MSSGYTIQSCSLAVWWAALSFLLRTSQPVWFVHVEGCTEGSRSVASDLLWEPLFYGFRLTGFGSSRCLLCQVGPRKPFILARFISKHRHLQWIIHVPWRWRSRLLILGSIPSQEVMVIFLWDLFWSWNQKDLVCMENFIPIVLEQ